METDSSHGDQTSSQGNGTSQKDNSVTLRTKSTLGEDLFRRQREREGNADIAFIFHSGETIKVHSLVLCAASCKWQEELTLLKKNNRDLKIRVPDDISLEIGVKILHMIYMAETLHPANYEADLENPLQWFGIDKKTIIKITQPFRQEQFIEERIGKFKQLHVRFTTKDREDFLMGTDGIPVLAPPEVMSAVERSNEIIRLFCTLCGTVCKSMGDIDNHPTKTSCPVNASLKLLDSMRNRYVTFTCKTCGNSIVDLSAYPSHKKNGPIPSRLSLPVSSSPMATGKNRISVIPDSNNAPIVIPHASTCMHCKKNFYNRAYCKSCQQVFSTQVEEDEHGNSCLYDAGVAPLDDKTVSTCNVDGCVLQFVTTSSPDKGLALHKKNAHALNVQRVPSPKRRPTQPKKTGTAIQSTKAVAGARVRNTDIHKNVGNSPRPSNPLARKGTKAGSIKTGANNKAKANAVDNGQAPRTPIATTTKSTKGKKIPVAAPKPTKPKHSNQLPK